MNSIFVSYRREDGAAEAGRIADRLQLHFGEEMVFQDVDNIPLGIDFRKFINTQLDRCQVFLVIIGDRWLDTLRERQAQPGQVDYVFYEVEAAILRNNIPIIPVLVGNASVPIPDSLPESIRPLSYRNGITVRSDDTFEAQIETLIEAIEIHLEQVDEKKDASPSKPRPFFGSAGETRRGCSAHFGKISVAIAICIGLFAVRGLLMNDRGIGDRSPATSEPVASMEEPLAQSTDNQAEPAESGRTRPTSLGPTGSELSFPEGSREGRLADALSNPERRLPLTFTLDAFEFSQDSDQASNSEARTQLGRTARIARSYPTLHISIQGHIDASEADQTLSTKRARYVYGLLLRSQVPRDQLSFRGMGSRSPASTENTEAGRQRNRRVELVFTER